MALPHAQPGETIAVRPLGTALAQARSHALIKTHALELMRLVLPAGESLPPHSVPGELVLMCVEGRVRLDSEAARVELAAGELVLLPGETRYALQALEASSLLATVQLPAGAPGSGSATVD